MKLDIENRIKLDKNRIKMKFPVDIIQETADIINTYTDGLINIRVNKYDGPIESYSIPNGITTALMRLSMDNVHNIQDDLGEQGDDFDQNYEVIIQSDYLTGYKYRIMFFRNSISGYPTTIVLEEGLAEEINQGVPEDYVLSVDGEEKLEQYTKAIFESEYLINIINRVMIAAAREKEKENKCHKKK